MRYLLSLQHDPSRRTALSVLRRLQLSTQVSLQREPLYWLLYNAIVLTYSICRKAMALGYSGEVVEHLLWASVCMESSVPLMAAKYLRLRVCLYVAVCQCYYDVKQPVQAELFAREHLTKVTELARMEFESSSEATESSERAFREAAVKLEVMIFRQSVFETRKKIKSLFRPKIRPTIKELLLAPTSPRYIRTCRRITFIFFCTTIRTSWQVHVEVHDCASLFCSCTYVSFNAGM